MKEVSFKSVKILSISIVLLMWSAGKGFYALCKGLQSIYKTERNYNYWYLKIKSLFCLIIFILIIITVLFIVTFGRAIVNIVKTQYSNWNILLNILLKFRSLWQIFILFIIFISMYKLIPNHKVKFKTQKWGALFSALSWYLLSWMFSIYLEVFKNFSVIYGSLTSIILLMLWVYWCMYVILVGAEINLIKQKKNLENNLNSF